ncbi:MAG: hypothetical protein AAF558_02090 [Verrucomicrobiota bacterium]
MPARKKRPARKASARKKTSTRRSRAPKSSSNNTLLIALVLVSMVGMGVSTFMLIQEKQKNSPTNDLSRKVEELAKQHPDAEVFNLDQPEKKK